MRHRPVSGRHRRREVNYPMKPEKTFRAAIFDLDGTLAYTVGDLLASMNRMLRQYGYPEKTHDQIMSYISCGERDFVKFSLPEELQQDDTQIETCRETYVSIYNAHFLDSTVLYPGLTSFCTA